MDNFHSRAINTTESALSGREVEPVAIDWQRLHLLSDGDRAFEWELLQVFIEDAQAHLQLVDQTLQSSFLTGAIAPEQLKVLQQETHHLKGSSANVGATKMQTLALQLEQLTQGPEAAQKIEEAIVLLRSLQQAFQQVQTLVQQRQE